MKSYQDITGKEDGDIKEWSVFQLLACIVEWDYTERLINLVIALRIFLTHVRFCCKLRSFSKLKLIKTYLRSTMSQSRLTSLSFISVERETASTLTFEDVVADFAALKARKCLQL